jgi:hypothetical protein
MNEFLTQFFPFAERNPVLTVIMLVVIFGGIAQGLTGLGKLGQRKCNHPK